jgi:hypothetical protein
MAIRQLAVTICLAACATSAAAVEKKPIQVTERWSVVGVIAGDDEQGKEIGIAVLKNNETRRTYTVSLGETLPTDYGFTLHKVVGRQVSVSDGDKTYVLGYAEASMTDDVDTRVTEADATRASRFLDTYYRSFDEVPADADAAAGAERPGYDAPLQRFSTLREQAARSRFELFRPDRPYNSPEEGEEAAVEAGEEGGFVVNYDNFTDEGATEASGEPMIGGACSDAPLDQDVYDGEPAGDYITE